MDEFQVEDGSNDKAYFTMVPNIVLNHSSAVDQALYMQMKRFAGEKRGGGFCTASEKTLMAKLKIGRDSLKESIAYLIEHKWISFAGENVVWTEGGPQKVKAYRVNDIWRMNVEHYKGVSETAPPHEGVAETVKGVSRTAQGVAETAPTKNYKTIEGAARFVSTNKDGDEIQPKSKDSFSAEYRELCDWAAKRRGGAFVSMVKQFAALKKAREHGIGPAKLKKRWAELEGQDFYIENGLDWASVVSNFDRKV